FPFAPQSCQRHWLLVFSVNVERVGFIVVMVVFIKAIYINNAAVVFCGSAKGGFFKDGLPSCIEGIVPLLFHLLFVLYPMWHKAPSCNFREFRRTVSIYKQLWMTKSRSVM